MDVRRFSALLLFLGIGYWISTQAAAQGPDEKGAVLNTDFGALPAPKKSTVVPVPRQEPPGTPRLDVPTPDLGVPRRPADTSDYVRSMLVPDSKPADKADPNARRGLGGDEAPDVNRDLALSPAAGQWLLMIMSYPGDQGALRARKFCLELRNTYKVPAYVFVYGAEERRKERERVRKIVEQHNQFLKEKNLPSGDRSGPTIRHQFIEVHHAVLVGGYADVDAANAMLNRIKKTWDQPDPKKVDLDFQELQHNNGKEYRYVNPFKRAFVARNPTMKTETHEQPKLDVAMLRRLNASEPFSLFKCKKPYTLAVKEFQTKNVMHDTTQTPGLFDLLVGANRPEVSDPAQFNAHNVAETLTKLRVPAPVFVLHSKFSSTVTIGEFDGPDDPSLKQMQDLLADRLSRQPYAQVQFFYRPVPMAVPR